MYACASSQIGFLIRSPQSGLDRFYAQLDRLNDQLKEKRKLVLFFCIFDPTQIGALINVAFKSLPNENTPPPHTHTKKLV